MCGINGIAGFNDSQIAEKKVQQMNTAMAHRGPDDHGLFVHSQVVLGHRRLSIIDLSAAGHQPMESSDGRFQIVYNGELYNFKQLKFELQRVVAGSSQKAYIFNTQTDTEVILAAYQRWGSDCLRMFNGMFAFAIYDKEKNELFIARDRMGIKPLYYFFTNGVLGFSSELRSLLASDLIERRLDLNGLQDYLRYQTVHAPNTIIKGVKMLLPGHFITYRDKQASITKYWSASSHFRKDLNGKDYSTVCSDVKELLTRSVERRLIADVPFGAFLSGGIDSSAVVGLMASISSEPVQTFNVSFEEGAFSESAFAKQIAQKFNTKHHEIVVRPTDFLKELPDALKAMDHPSGDGPNTYVVSKATKEAGITMALSGLGGDELFAGYDVFQRALKLEKSHFLKAMPGVIRKLGGATLQRIRPGVASDKLATLLNSDSISLKDYYPVSRQVMMDDRLKRLLNIDHLSVNELKRMMPELELEKLPGIISQVSVLEINSYMQNVLLRDTDQMSMASALEVRVPFLDYTLVEYVIGLKDEFKFPSSPKRLLVDSLGDLLPSEIVHRKKMGFTFPWSDWMRNDLRSFCQDRIFSLAKRPFMNEKEVVELWNLFLKSDKRVTWSRVWYLVVLENWMLENNIVS